MFCFCMVNHSKTAKTDFQNVWFSNNLCVLKGQILYPHCSMEIHILIAWNLGIFLLVLVKTPLYLRFTTSVVLLKFVYLKFISG